MTELSSGEEKVPKRRRNPERTREAILEIAGKLLSKDGPEGLSVSEVAQQAGVNRGTAYHHFQTRDQLLKATTEWVSRKLCSEVFGDDAEGESDEAKLDPYKVTERLALFAMENPEFGRVWLFEVLSSSQPASDPFWTRYKMHVRNFAASDLALPDIDHEVHAIQMLVGVFLWPVWARVHATTESERIDMAKRYSKEMMRMSLHGSMRKEKFAEFIRENENRP